MAVFIDFLWLVLGLVLLYFGAEWLVHGARELSLRLGIGPLVVGLTVVAFGTSAPELLVSLQANLQDPPKGDMALGNVVGSNICNIALILGAGALIRPIGVHLQILRKDLPVLLLISLAFVGLLQNGVITRWEGALLFGGVILYTVISLVQARREPDRIALEAGAEDTVEAAGKKNAGRLLLNLFLVVAGITGLVYGADRLVYGGSGIAREFGISEATIALTIVAFGTSLPELATSVVAALKKQGDLIIGNAIGSCIFNILCVVGLTASVAPLARSPDLQNADLLVMLGLTVIILPFLWSRKNLSRVEGGILLGIYAGYVAWLGLR